MDDDELTLYYFRDGLTDERRREIDRAVGADPVLARRYAALCAMLDGVPADTARGPDAAMRRRWHDTIDRAAATEGRRAKPSHIHAESFAWGAALAATLVVGVFIGQHLAGSPVLPPADPVANMPGVQAPAVPAAFARGLQVHLRRSGEELAVLPVDSAAERMVLIASIVEQNRRYLRAADSHDAQHLARVLRAFELVLLQLAVEDLPAERARELQTKLQFELSVMLTKLAADTSNDTDTI